MSETLEKILSIIDAMSPEQQEAICKWDESCEWPAGKMVVIVKALPEEEREVVLNKYSWVFEPSPRVVKVFDIIKLMSPEEKETLLKMVYNENCDSNLCCNE